MSPAFDRLFIPRAGKRENARKMAGPSASNQHPFGISSKSSGRIGAVAGLRNRGDLRRPGYSQSSPVMSCTTQVLRLQVGHGRPYALATRETWLTSVPPERCGR